jgi:hypothetical protein
MKAEIKKEIQVTTVFEAPLYGFDIEKVYTQKQKEQVKQLLIELLDNDLSYLERTIDSVTFKVKIDSSIRSLNI